MYANYIINIMKISMIMIFKQNIKLLFWIFLGEEYEELKIKKILTVKLAVQK